MESGRTVLQRLRNLHQYLSDFGSQKSIYFELTIAKVLKHIFYLPFYTSDNDDNSVPHRVVWLGRINPISSAPGGGSDIICYCCNFYIIGEVTRRPGTDQWARIYAQSIRHCENFCSEHRLPPNNVYILLVCNRLHQDTYRSIKSNPRVEYNFIPLEVSELARILETSILAFTMKHLEIRKLFLQISDSIRNSTSLDEFRNLKESNITAWQKDVLNLEKSVFIGLKSFEVMKKIGRSFISMSEILQRLQKHPTVGHYFNIIGDTVRNDIIRESLIQESLASLLTYTITDGEELFEPVPVHDYMGRNKRLINELNRIK